MALDDDDVREIFRIIDESELAELRIETEGLSLHVLRGGARACEPGARRAVRPGRWTVTACATASRSSRRCSARSTARRRRGSRRSSRSGRAVEPDTIVCIIEVMKMMNSVPAGVAGTIAEIHVDNAQPVEYGEPLFRVQPA